MEQEARRLIKLEKRNPTKKLDPNLHWCEKLNKDTLHITNLLKQILSLAIILFVLIVLIIVAYKTIWLLLNEDLQNSKLSSIIPTTLNYILERYNSLVQGVFQPFCSLVKQYGLTTTILSASLLFSVPFGIFFLKPTVVIKRVLRFLKRND